MGRQQETPKSAGRAPKARALDNTPDANETPVAAASSASFDREQAIREVAYACFEARGGAPGYELDDWLKAEALVMQANGG
jgi:hypothetical protein